MLQLENLFPLFGSLPLLTERDLADPGSAINRRRLDEVHSCVFCGDRALVAIVAGPSDMIGRPQWLDLCAEHGRELRLAVDADPFLGDAEIVRRYSRWRAERDAEASRS